MNWILAHWQAVLVVLGLGLGVVVAGLKLAGKDDAAATVKKVEDVVDELDGQSKPQA